METGIAVAAQIARPTIPFVLKSVLPAETESRLDRIFVADEEVYETRATDQFQAHVGPKPMAGTEPTFVFDAEAAIKAATLAVIGITTTWKLKLQESDREDIVAEAVAKAWTYRDSYNPSRASFKTWIGSITRNVLLDHIRRSKARKGIPVQENDPMTEKSPDTLFMENEGVEAIQRAVERLPKAYRDIIVLLSEGRRPKDIAGILGCSSNAATIRSCRARKALRELLQGNLQESGRQ